MTTPTYIHDTAGKIIEVSPERANAWVHSGQHILAVHSGPGYYVATIFNITTATWTTRCLIRNHRQRVVSHTYEDAVNMHHQIVTEAETSS